MHSRNAQQMFRVNCERNTLFIFLMISFLVGVVSGFVLAIPPGPVATYTIQTTLSKGKRTGMSIGVGVAIVDMIFCLMILFASSALLTWMNTEIAAHPLATNVLKVCAILGIILYAVIQLRSNGSTESTSRIHLEQKVHSKKPLIIGSATALSNLFNPTFLPALTAILATISSQVPQLHDTFLDKWLFVLGFGTGTYGWLHSLISFVARHHERIPADAMNMIRRGGAIVFIVFALYLAWKLV